MAGGKSTNHSFTSIRCQTSFNVNLQIRNRNGLSNWLEKKSELKKDKLEVTETNVI